jgi:hypothetical protein
MERYLQKKDALSEQKQLPQDTEAKLHSILQQVWGYREFR